MNEQQICKKLDEVGLARIAGKLKNYFLPAIKLESERVEETEVPVGSSKLGGRPDLPSNFAWFGWNSTPLSFVAQINLVDLPDMSERRLLPETGLLYFFYDSNQETWGFDPQDFGSWKVFYTGDAVESLIRTDFPSSLPPEGRFSPCKVSFSERLTLPFDVLNVREELGLNEQESQLFTDMILDLESQDAGHQIFGFPDTIQGEMTIECQLASNGVYCGNAEGYRDPRVPALESGAKDWMLLFQVDSDYNAEMMWGDGGRIYYWIRKQHLEKRDFEKVWLVLQCT